MIRTLIRWFRGGAGSGQRFTPRLEALEDRALPSGVVQGFASAALIGARVGDPSYVVPLGSKPGGVGDGILSGLTIAPALRR
jgi:hypothetical protein